MSPRNKLIFLTLALFLCSGMLVLHTNSRLYSSQKSLASPNSTRASNFLYRVYNLTYLVDLNDAQAKMDDPKLITAIRNNFLKPPAIFPYKLKDPNQLDTSLGQARVVLEILHQQKNGFFVEAGALDGETHSNTLILEREFNWTGLLVEPDPINFAQMVEKKRKSWLSRSCLSVLPYPHVMSFKQAFNISKMFSTQAGHIGRGFVDVQCLPLYSLLLALNRTTVDYLSLDIEGYELDVLRTIPFKDLNIRTLSVEYLKGKNKLLEYMEEQNYHLYDTVVHPNNLANDLIFFKYGAVSL